LVEGAAEGEEVGISFMTSKEDGPSLEGDPQSLDYAQATKEVAADRFVTRGERRAGRNVLLFSLVGWTLPVAATILSREWGAMIVTSVLIVAGFFTIQHTWGASPAGRIAMWIVTAWASLLTIYSMILALHFR